MGWELLALWMQEFGNQIDFHGKAEAIDETLSEFVTWAWRRKLRFYVVKHAILAVPCRVPRLRRHLTTSWRCLLRWEINRPWIPRIPFPEELLAAYFLTCVNEAAVATGKDAILWLSLGVVTRLAFFAMLRPGEARRLRARDLKVVRRPTCPPVLVIAIANPKTGHVLGAGRTQVSTTSDPGTIAWVELLLTLLSPDQLLWPGTADLFTKWFRRGLVKSHLDKLGLSPASMRSGGATMEFLRGTTMEVLSFKGRWVALNSLRSYLQEGAAHLVWASLPPARASEVEAFIGRYRTLLSHPPADLVWLA